MSSLGFTILYLINPEISRVPWATLQSDDLRGFLREKCRFLKIEGGEDFNVSSGMQTKPCPNDHE